MTYEAMGIGKATRLTTACLLLICIAALSPACALECAAPKGAEETAICGDDFGRMVAAAMTKALRYDLAALPKADADVLEAEQLVWQTHLTQCERSGVDIGCLCGRLQLRLPELYGIADTTLRSQQACSHIANLADRGAQALRAADLLTLDQAIDLQNDGHAETIRLRDAGTAHMPYLASEAGNMIDYDRASYGA